MSLYIYMMYIYIYIYINFCIYTHNALMKTKEIELFKLHWNYKDHNTICKSWYMVNIFTLIQQVSIKSSSSHSSYIIYTTATASPWKPIFKYSIFVAKVNRNTCFSTCIRSTTVHCWYCEHYRRSTLTEVHWSLLQYIQIFFCS